MCAPAGRAIYPSIISRLHHLGRAAAPGILCSALLRHCVHVMRPAYRRQPAALDSLFANDGIPLPRKRPRARSQKKKKYMHRDPPPSGRRRRHGWRCSYPRNSVRVWPGPPGAGLGRPLCVPAPVYVALEDIKRLL